MLIAALLSNLVAFTGLHVPWMDTSVVDRARQIVGAACGGGNARVIDGSWQRDLFLNPRVSLDEATTIVHAIRRGDVVNKQRIPSEGRLAGIVPAMPFIDADQITSISDDRLDDGSRVFNVSTGCRSGRSYLIVLVNKTLELREVRVWIA
jgi:hypothetical protein